MTSTTKPATGLMRAWPSRYVCAVAWRVLLASVGAYTVSLLAVMLLGRCLPALGMEKIDAVLAVTMLGFIVHAAMAMWVFAVARTRRATMGVLICLLVLAVLCWFLGVEL